MILLVMGESASTPRVKHIMAHHFFTATKRVMTVYIFTSILLLCVSTGSLKNQFNMKFCGANGPGPMIKIRFNSDEIRMRNMHKSLTCSNN